MLMSMMWVTTKRNILIPWIEILSILLFHQRVTPNKTDQISKNIVQMALVTRRWGILFMVSDSLTKEIRDSNRDNKILKSLIQYRKIVELRNNKNRSLKTINNNNWTDFQFYQKQELISHHQWQIRVHQTRMK